MTRHARAYFAWLCLSIIVGYTVAWVIAIAYAGRGVETALAAYCWGAAWVSVTPWALRWVGRHV